MNKKQRVGKLSPKHRRGVRIREPKHCVRLINKLINEVLTTDGDESREAQCKLRVCSYALSVLLKGFEVGDLGERMAKLEELCQSRQDLRK